MPVARYKDLCIDAVAAEAAARFWGELLGLHVERRLANVLLTGPTPRHTVWINEVREPTSTKQRVHLDVFGAGTEWAAGLGATLVEPFDRWSVFTDPEGGEFCLFTRETPLSYRAYELVVDCAEPEPIARWWADVFGAQVGHDDDDPWWWVEGIPGLPFETFVFVPVPEPKTVKNRIHWDVTTDSVEKLVDAGATVLRAPGGDNSWTVLADPDGNEFCAFTD